jgi:SNF2 family DNA or RNA helicase
MSLTAHADIWALDPKRIEVTCDFRSKDAVKEVPGARWSPEHRVWHTPLTWPACVALRSEFGDGLTIGSELRAWAYDIGRKKKVLAANRAVLDLDGWISPSWASTFLPDGLPGFEDLYDPQVVDALLIELAERYLLFNETGSGKSRSALAGLSLLRQKNDIFPLMIVAPKSMGITWQREVARFFPGHTTSMVTGTPAKIRKALVDPTADIFIIGWEALRKYSRLARFGSTSLTDDEKLPKEIQDLAPQSIIFDECHRACNPTSKRTRAAWAVAEDARYRIGLTGSPIEESPEDLYGILHLIFPDEYPTKTSYVERYLEIDFNEWGGREVKGIHPDREDEFRRNFSAISRRLTKAVMHPFLPEKIREVRWVELPPKFRKAYNDMQDKFVAELDSGVLAAENALVKSGRLIQLANAGGIVDAEGVFHMDGESPKIVAFMDDVLDGDFDGEDSRQLIELLAEEMTKKKVEHVMITGSVTGDDRQAAMDTFQEGKVPFCLLTRAGGEGITLTAASTMVRLIRPWSYRTFTQVEDRVHRIGSEVHEVIRYVDYITEDTLEMGQMARLIGKGLVAEEVLRDDELLKLLKEPPKPEDLLP